MAGAAVSGLPPIPDEAVEAVGNYFHDQAPMGDTHRAMLSAVELAWPHLYAAALRHVADVIADNERDPVRLLLLRLADEATP
jgi:hypothetical protein